MDISKGTVYRAKRRYAEEGLDGVLQDRVQAANRYRKLDDKGEAHLIALACSPAPDGHDYWTLHLLADRVVDLGSWWSPCPMRRWRLKNHTPKHVSWLNMAEIEFSVLTRACLQGRNPDENVLQPWRKQQWCLYPQGRG